MEKKNELQVLESTSDNMLVFGSQANFEQAMRMAKSLCASSIVPVTYQGEKGLPNCIIALEMANRIGMSPLMVMQNLYVVHGNGGWSSKFLIAAINSCGKFSPIRYEFKGTEGKDDWGCRAWAIDKTSEKLFGSWVTIEMAKKEGWYGKSGSKWQTMPELMLQYRAGAFFQRTYAPEISMGMSTAEELYDVDKPIDVPYEDVTDKVKSEIENNANQQTINPPTEQPETPPSQPAQEPKAPATQQAANSAPEQSQEPSWFGKQ